MSKQFDLVLDRTALDLIEALKPALNAKSVAEVLKKSLGLAKLVVDHGKNSNGVVTMRGKGRPDSEAVNLDIRN